MADTREVLSGLDLSNTATKLLAIVANLRGAQDAVSFAEIDVLGYPLSVSETFQRQNTNSTIAESLRLVAYCRTCVWHIAKKLVIYLSMAFGNPYGDQYAQDYVLEQAANIARSWASALFHLQTLLGSLHRTGKGYEQLSGGNTCRDTRSAYTCTQKPATAAINWMPPLKPDVGVSTAH